MSDIPTDLLYTKEHEWIKQCEDESCLIGITHHAQDSLGDVTYVELPEVGQSFEKNEVSEIWITFPDPQIKYKRTKHRLITKTFLEKYQSILKPDGLVHLKTDSEFLHGYLLGLLHEGQHEILYAHHDIYNSSSPPAEAKAIQTFYENQYLKMNKAITYVKFRTKY